MNYILLKRRRVAALELEIKLLRAIINKKIELTEQILHNDDNKRGDQDGQKNLQM